MNDDDEKVENAMSLSFLDVISCGMVSSIFLAIIFSVIGYTPAISLRTKNFIAIILELEEDDTQVYTIAIKTPGTSELKYLPLKAFDMTTGCYVREDGNKLYNNMRLFGFPSSDYVKDGVSSGNFRIFFISEPTYGKWEVRVPLPDDLDSMDDLDSIDDKPKELKNIHIITSSKNKDVVIERKDMEVTEYREIISSFDF